MIPLINDPSHLNCRVFELGKGPVPTYPSLGLQIVRIEEGEVIDVVVQNNPGNSFSGDYRPNGASRNSTEQHPFHLHGHHFWVLGSGAGVYNASGDQSALNLVDPPLRDTATLPKAGWLVFRFLANNPGVWPLHCHIMWHH